MSVQPLKPTSLQPRSSATMWTMFGFGGVGSAARAEETASVIAASARRRATMAV
jgi:hypothetical protein